MKRSFNPKGFVTHSLGNAGLRCEFSKLLKVVSSGLDFSGCVRSPHPFPIQGMGTNLSSALVIKARVVHSFQIAAQNKGAQLCDLPIRPWGGLTAGFSHDCLALFTPHATGL